MHVILFLAWIDCLLNLTHSLEDFTNLWLGNWQEFMFQYQWASMFFHLSCISFFIVSEYCFISYLPSILVSACNCIIALHAYIVANKPLTPTLLNYLLSLSCYSFSVEICQLLCLKRHFLCNIYSYILFCSFIYFVIPLVIKFCFGCLFTG